MTQTAPLMILILLLIGFNSAPLADTRYRYRETSGDKTTHYIWELQGSDPVTVLSIETEKTFRNVCKADGATVEWEVKEASDWIFAVRDGENVRIKAHLKGEAIETTVELDEDPWFQALSFSLRPWLESGRDTVRFWMIRPDKLEAHKLKAERNGSERIRVGGETVAAYRVKVKLSGAFAMFWSVKYWFRKDDLLLVRYEGVHGPPGTPKTVITLESVMPKTDSPSDNTVAASFRNAEHRLPTAVSGN